MLIPTAARHKAKLVKSMSHPHFVNKLTKFLNISTSVSEQELWKQANEYYKYVGSCSTDKEGRAQHRSPIQKIDFRVKGDKEMYYCSITVISCKHKERLGLL